MEGDIARKGLYASVAAAVAVGAALLAPVVVSAHHDPQITGGPTISGVPQEGQTLTAKATWTGSTPPTPAWKWQRCLATDIKACTVIKGATADTYVAATADVGFVLRVRLIVTNTAGTHDKRSAPTSVVQAKAAPPPPSEVTPEPAPEPEDDPQATPFNPPSDPGTGSPPPAADQLRVMEPFPVVRISGRLTGSGADVTRLSVRASRGASISVRCRGGSCPARSFARAARVKRLAAFERHLRAGTKLDVVVRQPGRIGKWTTITIRRGAPPKRVDLCSYPGRGRPAACPTA
jgi:hypothetical protein